MATLNRSNDDTLCLLPPKKYGKKVECKQNRSKNNKSMLKRAPQPTTLEENTSAKNKVTLVPSVEDSVKSPSKSRWLLLDNKKMKKKSFDRSKSSSSSSSSLDTKLMGKLDNNTDEESFHASYRSRCQSFNFQQLVDATSNFSSGLFLCCFFTREFFLLDFFLPPLMVLMAQII